MIIGLQRQQTEVGRIRLGVLIPARGGKKSRPSKLSTLRFTSARRNLIEEVAARYGGTVAPWQPPRGQQAWEVITKVSEVPVLVPPQDPSEGQWLEAWSAGGCLRRCDGVTERISNNPCICKAQQIPQRDACKMHTRLRVMLEDIPGLGAWRVDTGSYYAAVELPGIAELLAMAQGIIPARLVLEQRTVTRNGETMNFAVPALHVDEVTPRALLAPGGLMQAITAARAQAVAAEQQRQAITATAVVDWSTLALAASTLEALTDLRSRAKAAGAYDDDMKAVFTERARAIRNGAPAPAGRGEEVIEGDVVWPEVAAAGDRR